MPLILAIEPDRRQAAHLTTVVRKRVHAELILVSTTEKALDAIGNRVPDLVLVPALLSPTDDAALAQALRVIATAANVQMLTIPVLGAPRPTEKSRGVFSALRRSRKSEEPEGCDPDVFAEQIRSYLEHAALERGNVELDEESPTAAVEPPATPDVEPAPVATVRADVDPPPADFIEPAIAAESVLAENEAQPADIDESPTAAEPVFAAVADESVSRALVEAVRGLFSSDPQPVAEKSVDVDVTPVEDPVRVAEAEPAVEAVAVVPFREFVEDDETQTIQPPDEAVVEPVAAAAMPTLTDVERAAVEELVAALEHVPLALIETAEQPDSTPPPVEARERERAVEKPEKIRPAAAKPRDERAAVEPRRPAAVAVPPAPVAAAPAPPAAPPPPVPAAAAASVAAAPPPPAAAAAAPAAHAEHQPGAAKSEREWIALIESLRADVERLRKESTEKPAAKQPPPKPAPRAAKPKKPKPVQDEWGFFDPEQCGFAALLAKLEEVTDEESTPA